MNRNRIQQRAKAVLILIIPTLISWPLRGSAQGNEAVLIGQWFCGPYEMTSDDLTITTTEQKHYKKNGQYLEWSNSILTMPNGAKTRMQIQMDGSWQLSGDLVTVTFTKATFLSSDNPNYPQTLGQAQVDKQLQKKNWAKHQIDILGDKMIYSPIDAMYKEADVVISCVNLIASSGLEL